MNSLYYRGEIFTVYVAYTRPITKDVKGLHNLWGTVLWLTWRSDSREVLGSNPFGRNSLFGQQ